MNYSFSEICISAAVHVFTKVRRRTCRRATDFKNKIKNS